MIKIGITERHGIADEYSKHPPEGVVYSDIEHKPLITDHIFKSNAKGVLNYYQSDSHDIIEAPLFPILTNNRWIFTPARFTSGTNFNLFGIPLPRTLRIQFIKKLMLRNNFKKLIFKSHAGMETLKSYANLTDHRLLEKTTVVYPAIRKVDSNLIKFNKHDVNILFSGEFFRKGGVNVVDAFERLQSEFRNIHLRVCSPPDFQTNNIELKKRYLEKLNSNDDVTFDFVSRKIMLEDILPNTDIFVSPTYQEAYGYALEEAMAYGIPIVTTNHFAIPEIVEHNTNGFLIETDQFEYIKNSKGYVINNIPNDFHEYMSEEVYQSLKLLINDYSLRKTMGLNGLNIALTKFSFEKRNKMMKDIYKQAMD